MSLNLSFEQTRDVLTAMADYADEYAGLPCGIEGENLIVHPKYRFAEVFKRKKEEPADYTVVNCWHSKRRSGVVYLMRESDGRLTHLILPDDNIGPMLSTLGAQVAWSIEAEAKAQQKLAELLKHHAFRSYLLTGSFLETSQRSGITYFFRRCRPTVALKGSGNVVKFLASLCLHPIGYYADSYAGAMVPTDEVIAHLVLMRGDEHAFWKWSNQHQVIHQ
jgi:hypothetical protein